MAQVPEMRMREKTFICVICCEVAVISQKFQHKNTKSFHDFCINCTTIYIQGRVENNICTINCLDLSCDMTLDPIELQPLIPPSLFIRWCDSLCNLYISGFRNCNCPYSDCSELIINECGESIKWLCSICKRYFCYRCRVPWHAGYRCNESYGKRDKNEIEFGHLLEKMKWTRCPACGQSIERNGGCQIITCRCGKSFCHNCGSGETNLHRCPVEDADRFHTTFLPTFGVFCVTMLLCFSLLFQLHIIIKFS